MMVVMFETSLDYEEKLNNVPKSALHSTYHIYLCYQHHHPL